MPAVLVKTAFISNSSDANLLNTRQDDFANAIANQILNYFGVSNSTIKDILKKSGNYGLFENLNLEFEALNLKTPISLISLNPAITVQGEISFIGPYDHLILSLNSDTLTTTLSNSLSEAWVVLNFNRENLKASIEKLTSAHNIGNIIKYYIELEPTGALLITFGTSYKYSENTIVYQRLILKIIPNRNSLDYVSVVATSKFYI